jgi:hypothetical protein
MKGLVAFVLVAACGGNSGTTPDSPPMADASPDAPSKKYGFIGVAEAKAANQTAVLGIFGTDLDVTVSSRDDGPCQIVKAYAGSNPPVGAGTVTVSGGTAAPVMITFDTTNNYFFMTSGFSYATNDQLSVSATGATVPAFSGTIAFPASLTVTSPVPTSLSKTGFTTTWTPTTSTVSVAINQYPSGAPKLNILCLFDGAAGTGTVPASALADVATGVPVAIGISTRTDVMMTAGDYAIDLLGIYGARTTNGVPVQP